MHNSTPKVGYICARIKKSHCKARGASEIRHGMPEILLTPPFSHQIFIQAPPPFLCRRKSMTPPPLPAFSELGFQSNFQHLDWQCWSPFRLGLHLSRAPFCWDQYMFFDGPLPPSTSFYVNCVGSIHSMTPPCTTLNIEEGTLKKEEEMQEWGWNKLRCPKWKCEELR